MINTSKDSKASLNKSNLRDQIWKTVPADELAEWRKEQ